MLKLKNYYTTEVGNKIELPSSFDLIQFPFCSQVDFEDLYRNANSDLKNILDKVPLRNDTKYVSVNMTTQLLSPRVTAAPRGNWHFDANSFKETSPTHIHLLISDCTAVTEFTENDIDLPLFTKDSTIAEVELYMNKNLNLIKPKIADTSRFITFNGAYHFHRAVRAKKEEIRFTMRVMESDAITPSPFVRAVTNTSYVFDDKIKDYSQIDNNYIQNNITNSYESIVKENSKITLILN